MAHRGVHFALSGEEVATLQSFEDDDERLAHLQEVIEERYFGEARDYLAESDKAWNAIHRALSDGELTFDGGDYPLNHVVLGGESLYDDDDYVMSLKTPEQVKDIAAALAGLSEQEFRRRYEQIDNESYDGGSSDQDFDYTWGNFQDVLALYARAAIEGRFVLFTVDL